MDRVGRQDRMRMGWDVVKYCMREKLGDVWTGRSESVTCPCTCLHALPINRCSKFWLTATKLEEPLSGRNIPCALSKPNSRAGCLADVGPLLVGDEGVRMRA